MNYFRRFRDWAISGALLAIPFFFLSANLKDPTDLGVFDRTLVQISAPIQYAATGVADAVSSLLEEYFYLVEVKEDNDRMHEHLAEAQREVYALREAAEENERLRQLLALRERLPGQTLTARVIGRETSPYFRVIRIRLDRGEGDDVRVGMPVVSSQGLVGQIRRNPGQGYSDVLLTVDRSSAIDVVSERSGARGILRGTGEDDRYLCKIQYLQRSDEITPGEEIYTSGLGQRFPASILVGRVTNVEVRSDSGLYQMVEVTPSVDFSNLEEVLVLTSGSRSHGIVPSSEDDG